MRDSGNKSRMRNSHAKCGKLGRSVTAYTCLPRITSTVQFSHRFKDTLVNTVGHLQTEHLLCLGKLLSSAEACKIGLVDHVVEKAEVMSETKNEIQKWLAIPGNYNYILLSFLQ